MLEMNDVRRQVSLLTDDDVFVSADDARLTALSVRLEAFILRGLSEENAP
ncbi:MAG: hypothetical protein ABIF28_18815 [Pseudomonadota bacterium]